MELRLPGQMIYAFLWHQVKRPIRSPNNRLDVAALAWVPQPGAGASVARQKASARHVV